MKKKTITPEQMAQRLAQALGDRLRTILLYGSAAAGDFVDGRSDYNLLVVTDQLGVEELDAVAGPIAAWTKEGNPPPLCFTHKRLLDSADVFPLEMLDLKERRRVLYGEDCVATIEVSQLNLRHQLEYELRSKLLQLRERYLQVAGRPQPTTELLIESLSSFLTLFRGVLRLLDQSAEGSKLEALRRLGSKVNVSVEAFEVVHDLKTGDRSRSSIQSGRLFQQYLTTVESVVDKVDELPGHTKPSEAGPARP